MAKGAVRADRDREELPDVEPACETLAAGGVVVVPNPAPMTYSMVASSARAINAVKQRPPDQSVAVSLHDESNWEQLEPVIDLTGAVLDAVVEMLRRRLSVLIPLRTGMSYPRWVMPAVRDGYLAAFNGFWMPTARLWTRFPQLYGSSANITGGRPAECAIEAAAVFASTCAVIDGDPVVGPAGPRWASTMVRINRAGQVSLYRTGADDKVRGLTGPDYVRWLTGAVGLPQSSARFRPGPER